MGEFKFTVKGVTPDGEPVAMHCTPDNSELYIHSDQWKDVDHIFYRLPSDPERKLGAFLWRSVLGTEFFDSIGADIWASGDYQVHYRPQPTETDIEQYLDFAGRDLDGGLPD